MKKLTTAEFIDKAHIIHHNIYNYSKSVYIVASVKIEIICNIHGSFWQAPNDHLKGRGCPSCFGNKKLSLAEFIDKANLVHNHKYDYSTSGYINNDTKVKILCKEHGEFWQIAGAHLAGRGCLECGIQSSYNKRVKELATFVVEANIVHNNIYNYTASNYIGALSDIVIICPKHGKFTQRASAHLMGQRCPKCSNNYISQIEVKWLNSLGVPIKYRQKSLFINGKKYRVDAFDSTTNTIYEFYGDFWHGNPKVYNPTNINWRNKISFAELYDKTLLRENIYLAANYKVISIWENDFKNQLLPIKSDI